MNKSESCCTCKLWFPNEDDLERGVCILRDKITDWNGGCDSWENNVGEETDAILGYD